MDPLTAWLTDAEVLLAQTRSQNLDSAMDRAVAATVTALTDGRPLLVCGNGGSAADAQHIVGEMVGRFLRERRALKAICLSSNPAVLTAWSNDYAFDTVFSRQVEAYGERGGVILGISTSGNSRNVVLALEAADDRAGDIDFEAGAFVAGGVAERRIRSSHADTQAAGAEGLDQPIGVRPGAGAGDGCCRAGLIQHLGQGDVGRGGACV